MAVTYEPIASTTLGSAASSVTFGSGGTLPQTYTDLILVMEVKSSYNSTVDGGCIRFYGDTGSNYSITRLAGSGSSATSDRQSSATTPIVRIAGNTGSASTPVIYHIMSYSSSSVYKTGLVTSSESQSLITKGVLLWCSTAAITSIVVFPENGPNFNSGSTFSLYGIKAA